jgi:hypothetical protein
MSSPLARRWYRFGRSLRSGRSFSMAVISWRTLVKLPSRMASQVDVKLGMPRQPALIPACLSVA